MKTILLRRIKDLLIILCLLFITTSCTTWKLGKTGQKKIAGKTYVIVGASSGIGRGVAQELGKYKANVVLAARRTDLLEEIADSIRASGGNAVVVTMDISKPEDLQRVSDVAIKEYSKIDVWINMAGVAALGRFWDVPVEDHARVAGRPFLGRRQLVADVRAQPLALPDDTEPDVVLEEQLELAAQIVLQQPHERGDLGVRALPVLDRERVQREHGNPEARRGLDRGSYGLRAGTVPFDTWKMPGRRPAAVAVHDDRDVARQPREIHTAHERVLHGPLGHGREHVGKSH